MRISFFGYSHIRILSCGRFVGQQMLAKMQRRYTCQQLGTKGGHLPVDKPFIGRKSNINFVPPSVYVYKESLVCPANGSFRTMSSMPRGATGTVVSWQTDPSASHPALPRYAPSLRYAPPRRDPPIVCPGFGLCKSFCFPPDCINMSTAAFQVGNPGPQARAAVQGSGPQSKAAAQSRNPGPQSRAAIQGRSPGPQSRAAIQGCNSGPLWSCFKNHAQECFCRLSGGQKQ